MTTYGFKLLRVEVYKGRGRTRLDFGQIGLLDKVQNDITQALKRAEEAKESAATAQDAAAHSANAAIEASTSESNAGDKIETVTEAEAEDIDAPEGGGEGLEDDDFGEGDTLVATDVAIEDVVSGSEDVVPDDEEASLSKRKRRDSVVKLEGLVRYNNALLIKMQYGIVGDHDYGVDPSGESEPVNLKRRATTRHYRAVLIAPPKGEVAFLAVETISRSHPGRELPRRLHQAAIEHDYKLRPRGTVADEPSINALLRDGHVDYVELIRLSTPSDGAVPAAANAVLKFNLGAKSSQEGAILSRVKTWIADWLSEPEDEDSDDAGSLNPVSEARDLAALLWKDAEELGFDTARVKVKSDKQSKTLQPLDVKEGFVYDLGTSALDDEKFFRRVATVAQSVFNNNEMDMPDNWLE